MKEERRLFLMKWLLPLILGIEYALLYLNHDFFNSVKGHLSVAYILVIFFLPIMVVTFINEILKKGDKK